MGHVKIDFRLANNDRPDRWLVVEDALVDTGATLTVIPRRYADELELKTVRTRRIRTAQGLQDLQECFARFEYNGEEEPISVLVSDSLAFALVGVTTLEVLGLMVDPTSGELRESEIYLL